MRIKEVEKATGLTAKAIRMYESKGLLSVARESENDYRDYSDEDVKRLKTIAVLRRLDISVKEIKEWCDGETQLRDLIARASYQARTAEAEQKAKVGLTGELLQILDEDGDADLPTAIEEAEELQSLYRELDDLVEEMKGDLFWPVWWTIITLGPVGWTFLHILDGNAEEAMWALVFSLVAIPFVCSKWFRYFQVTKAKRSKAGCLSMVIFFLCGIPLVIGYMILVSVCQERFLLPEGSIYVFRQPWVYVAMAFPLFQLFLMLEPEKKRQKLGFRGWLWIVGLNIVVLYCCIASVSWYGNGVFSRHSVLCPMGQRYSVSDVECVEAGFRGKLASWLPWRNTGDFYYEIVFADGTREDWTDLSGKDGMIDTWDLYLHLDQQLMEAGVEKVSNWENREDFPYDPSCLEIADEILNNK